MVKTEIRPSLIQGFIVWVSELFWSWPRFVFLSFGKSVFESLNHLSQGWDSDFLSFCKAVFQSNQWIFCSWMSFACLMFSKSVFESVIYFGQDLLPSCSAISIWLSESFWSRSRSTNQLNQWVQLFPFKLILRFIVIQCMGIISLNRFKWVTEKTQHFHLYYWPRVGPNLGPDYEQPCAQSHVCLKFFPPWLRCDISWHMCMCFFVVF